MLRLKCDTLFSVTVCATMGSYFGNITNLKKLLPVLCKGKSKGNMLIDFTFTVFKAFQLITAIILNESEK